MLPFWRILKQKFVRKASNIRLVTIRHEAFYHRWFWGCLHHPQFCVRLFFRADGVSWDMLFDLLYLTDWNKIGCNRQKFAGCVNTKENIKCRDFNNAIEDEVLIIKKSVDCKARGNHDGLFLSINVYRSGTDRIQCSFITECINIRRIIP